MKSAEKAEPIFGIDNVDLEGARGFVIFDHRRQERTFGYHVEVFVYDEMFERILKKAAPGYSLEIYSGSELIYRRARENLPLVEQRWKQQAELGQFGLSWSVAAWPDAATLQTSRSPLPVITLLVGIVVAMLLAFAVQLAQTSRQRASAIERVNRELENEMSGRKRAEEQLRQSQKMEAVGRLAGGIAHEFNNLLTVIYGYSDLLGSTLKDELEQRYVREIVRASKRARDLTGQLLAFSRRQVLDIRILDLCEVLRETRDMVQRLIGEDIALVLKPGADPCRIRGDQGQFQQVIINLAVNAREAMPEGGTLALRIEQTDLDELTASLAGLEAGRYCELVVQDTGVGMDEREVENIFEPFFTTKDRGQGTGLGLATVYGIVKQSNGGIRVTSSPGSGTTFRIYLPYSEEEETTNVLTGPDEVLDLQTRGTILLVEDEDAVRQLAEEVLRTQGYRVLSAVDGGDALAKIDHAWSEVDLLITDVVMPVMGGPKLADIVLGERPDLPVLFVSGYSEDGMVALHRPHSSGRAYLSKPFTPQDLKTKVQELLNSRRPRTRT